jgi:hypothetical protein
MFLSWISFATSWTYLRFFRLSPLMTSATGGDGDSIRGDASDTFAFAYFFPEPLHTPLAAVCEKIYVLLVSLRVCTPFSAEDVDVGNEQAMARAEGAGLPTMMSSRGSGRREEAERRRALALNALNQRLHATTSRGAAPTLESVVLTVPAPAARPDGASEEEPTVDSKTSSDDVD